MDWFRYIAPEQVPVQFGGLYREGESEFTVSDAVTEVTIKPSSKHTIDLALSEVRFQIIFSTSIVTKDSNLNNWVWNYQILVFFYFDTWKNWKKNFLVIVLAGNNTWSWQFQEEIFYDNCEFLHCLLLKRTSFWKLSNLNFGESFFPWDF